MVLFLGNKKVNGNTQASLPLFLSPFPVPFFSLPLTFWNMEVEHTFEKKKSRVFVDSKVGVSSGV